MKTGYLIAVTNPRFAGLATANFAKDLDAVSNPQPDTVDRVPVDAGHGVRQLMGLFKDAGLYPIRVDHTLPLVGYTLDEFGALNSIRFVQ